jgi:hypothetical protein
MDWGGPEGWPRCWPVEDPRDARESETLSEIGRPKMATGKLNRDTLERIIATYNAMQITHVPDVPTLLFERLGFDEDEVRHALGLSVQEDLMQELSKWIEEEFGICDLA